MTKHFYLTDRRNPASTINSGQSKLRGNGDEGVLHVP